MTPPINRRKSVRSTRRSTSCKMEPDADGENEVEREEEEEDEEPQPEGRYVALFKSAIFFVSVNRSWEMFPYLKDLL